jgi:hypothetical protein
MAFRVSVSNGLASQPRKAPRPVLPKLSTAQHLELGTGPLALMKCRHCGAMGCLIPVVHGPKTLAKTQSRRYNKP